MYTTHDLAVKFFSLYRQLAPNEPDIPRNTNALDKALRDARHALPDNNFARAFHFADTAIGLECIELRTLETYAESAGIITFPTPYTRAQFEISPAAARTLAADATEHERAFVAKVQSYFLKNAPAGI